MLVSLCHGLRLPGFYCGILLQFTSCSTSYHRTHIHKTTVHLEADSSEPAAALRYCEETEMPDTLCLRRRNACSTNIASDDGSIRQNEPLPDSSCDRATLMKYRFNDRLCRIEFCDKVQTLHVQRQWKITMQYIDVMCNSFVTYLLFHTDIRKDDNVSKTASLEAMNDNIICMYRSTVAYCSDTPVHTQ